MADESGSRSRRRRAQPDCRTLGETVKRTMWMALRDDGDRVLGMSPLAPDARRQPRPGAALEWDELASRATRRRAQLWDETMTVRAVYENGVFKPCRCQTLTIPPAGRPPSR